MIAMGPGLIFLAKLMGVATIIFVVIYVVTMRIKRTLPIADC
jgi:hypothetical protein